MTYVSIIEDPFGSVGNLKKLPGALRTLPMNAFLHQEWIVLIKLLGIVLILGIPTFVSLLLTASIYEAGFFTAIVPVSFIILGVVAAPAYLKLLYGIINDLIDTKKAPWLVEVIEKDFNDSYRKPWKFRWYHFGITIVIQITQITVTLFDVTDDFRFRGLATAVFWLFMVILSFPGTLLMVFLTINSYLYVRLNSKIYDKLLIRITARVRGYTDAQETILSKKNYEVVGILSDTPGLSIRSLGDIPVIGLALATIIVNSLIFLIIGPVFFAQDITPGMLGDDSGLNVVLLFGLVLSLIASFGAIIIPIFRVWWVIRKFKGKALTELDPFLFDEITGVALNRERLISNETQVLYMLRNYIYIMKPSPVNPLRLLQVGGLLILYFARALLAVG